MLPQSLGRGPMRVGASGHVEIGEIAPDLGKLEAVYRLISYLAFSQSFVNWSKPTGGA
jgi:hypothetical protein